MTLSITSDVRDSTHSASLLLHDISDMRLDFARANNHPEGKKPQVGVDAPTSYMYKMEALCYDWYLRGSAWAAGLSSQCEI